MMTTIDFIKVLQEFRPKLTLIKGYDRHIKSLKIEEDDQIVIYYSLWGVVSQIIVENNKSYADAIEFLIKKVHSENEKQPDVTYLFLDDLPDSQLN